MSDTLRAAVARKAEILATLDEICARADAERKRSHNPWLNPTVSDWMTAEEFERMHELQLELVALGPRLQAAAKARVAAKRAARAAAGDNS